MGIDNIYENCCSSGIVVRAEEKDEDDEKEEKEGSTKNSTLKMISTYEYQLYAFIKAIREGNDGGEVSASAPGSPLDAIQNMKVIDMIYKAGGLEPRKGLPLP